MMRFPLRLTADLALAHIAQKLRLAQGTGPMQFVDSAEVLHRDSSHPVSHKRIRNLIDSRSPVVWIGGSEPLDHPGIAHLVRAITQNDHFVFLETDGTLLRRRIHEFQPVSRLFLAVRLDSGARRRTSGGLRPGASEPAVEGIRAAKLSGFSICVHARVHAETELGEVAELIQFARSLDVDGIVISHASRESNSANSDVAALQRKTAESRALIENKSWDSFSLLAETVVSGHRHDARSAEESDVRLEQESQTNEESVRVA
jgi:molybdenum cofactor biosynthesis enzyme MoaA